MPGKHTIRKKKQLSWEAVGHSLRSRTAQCVYVILAGAVILCILFMAAITPQRYDLKVGDISHTTITASKDVVDEISTARQRETAANQVEPSYIFKEDVAGQVMQDLATVLAQVSAVQQYGRRVLEQYAPDDPDKQAEYVFAEAELNYARSLLTQISLADYQLSTLLRATDQQMADLNENITSAVENTLNTTIREGYVNESIQYLQQIIGYKTDIDLLQNVVTPILRKVIRPNMVIDQEATEKLRDEARAAVEPVIYKQGQNIVVARERVTANQLEMLRSLGMLDDDNVDIMMYVGAVLLVALVMIVLVTFVDMGVRRINVHFAKRVSGRKMYGGQNSVIPMKVVSVGVLPLIFAYSFMAFLGTIIQLVGGSDSAAAIWWSRYMNGASFWYLLVTALLIIAFTYFYSSISFQPDEMAKNIQQQGGAVPSVRPGKPTADYLRRINGRLTLFAALFLAILATVPTVFTVGLQTQIPFAASSILIAVSVVLETKRQLDDLLVSRNYDTLT